MNRNKIIWLISYPKSGNTWFRAFLTALFSNGELEINRLKTDGIFASRRIFDYYSEIDSRDLYHVESRQMIADVYRSYANDNEADEHKIIKVHDAFETDIEGNSIFPQDVTHCAIYIIRNPLDLAGSMANHFNINIQEAVNMLNKRNAHMTNQSGNFNKYPQFRQLISDWSSHVNGWTLAPPFPMFVVRYEDMLTNAIDIFKKSIHFIGGEYTTQQIAEAAKACSFQELSKQEKEKGFHEKSRRSPVFFRSGTMKNWERELTAEQIDEIRAIHKDTMQRYSY